MIWEENCLLPKNRRSAPGARLGYTAFGARLLENFLDARARRTAGVIIFLRSTPWKIFGVPLTWILILEYDDCKKICCLSFTFV